MPSPFRRKAVLLSGVATLAFSILCISPAAAAKVIFVRILVDEEEQSADHIWQKRLAKRVDAASAIIGQYANVRFVVRDAGRWQSDNNKQALPESLAEFEEKVDTKNVRLAIGFSSQHRFRPGVTHLGGTRGPLRHHILLREGAGKVGERQRMEALVHELGHFLCAAHCGEEKSVMRPVITNGKPTPAGYRIGFDQANAAILRVVGQELRDSRIDKFEELSPRTMGIMRKSYFRLSQQLPDDPVASQYLRVIDRTLSSLPEPDIDPGDVLIPLAPYQAD